MYSVFIVDDEVIVREGLRKRIDWEHSAFSFAGEAGDGEIALSMIQDIKPDILITDIRMPFMDGLELAREVKKIQPWIKILILSGHDEFDYAKKAISIGVEEYILKPFTPDEILASLTKIADALDKESRESSDISRMKRELESGYNLARDKMLTDLVLGAMDSSRAMEKAGEFGIKLRSRFYMVSVSEINSGDDMDKLLEAKSRISSSFGGEGICFFISPETLVAIVQGQTAQACEDAAFSFAESVKHEGEKVEGVRIVTAISNPVEHIASISDAFKEASHLLKRCRFTGLSRIVSSNDVGEDALGSDGGSLVLQENDPLVDRLSYAGESEIDQIVSEYISLLGNNGGSFSIIASYLLVDVIMAVSKVIESLGGDVKQVMPEILSRSFVENAVQSQERFIGEVKVILRKLLDWRNSRSSGRYSDVILRAKKFIDENYADPDICLRSVAQEVNFSPNHFSTVFSQDCGMTFIEYLTQVRIAQAKKLLKSTDRKSADIAYEVGFNDPHYFSFIFEKEVSLSPREWRQKNSLFPVKS